MQIPAELTKDEQKIRAALEAEKAAASTYEKSLLAFIVANRGKLIAIICVTALPLFLLGYELGKHHIR